MSRSLPLTARIPYPLVIRRSDLSCSEPARLALIGIPAGPGIEFFTQAVEAAIARNSCSAKMIRPAADPPTVERGCFGADSPELLPALPELMYFQ